MVYFTMVYLILSFSSLLLTSPAPSSSSDSPEYSETKRNFTATVIVTCLSGAIILLKILSLKGRNSKF